MGINDPWLELYKIGQRTYLLSAFASSCRRNNFGTTSKTVLRGNTVNSTVTHVCQTFRTHLRPDPALDANNKPSLFLTRQIAGFIDADLSKRQQKALPLCVFSTMYRNVFTPMDEAMGQLVCGAFFFGMRSCEYLTVSGTRKTKRLRIRNIRFFKNNLPLTDKRNPVLRYADTVSVTFEFQKNKQKNITVSQPRSGKEICPVIIWAQLVQRILAYKDSSENMYVNAIQIGKSKGYIKATEMYQHIVHTVNNTTGLGFTRKDVGTHSVRSSLAMALYLAKHPISTIILIGLWCSDAFLLYIRRQVQEFSTGISADMVSQERFFTIPDLDESDNLDPRTRTAGPLPIQSR